MVPTEASDEVRESASAPRGRGSRPEPSRDAQGASSSERPSTPSPAMEPEEVLSHFGVEEAKGLSWGQVKQTRIEDKHDNRIPPPIDCPAWICCLLPCILRVPKMLYFNQIAAEDADVIREGRWVRVDANSLVRGDVISLRVNERSPADVRVIHASDDFAVDASPISGDSVPIARQAHGEDASSPGGLSFRRSRNSVFCSAKCVSGEATGVVVATGAQTVLAQMIREKRWPPRMTPQAECGES